MKKCCSLSLGVPDFILISVVQPNIALIEQIETNCLIEIVTRALTVGTCSNIQYDLVYYMVDFID